jgi:hypothetical protein
MISLTEGIPQSDANPLVNTFNEAWEQAESERIKKDQERYAAGLEQLDSALLDWDSFSKGKPKIHASFSGSEQEAIDRTLAGQFIFLQNGMKEPGNPAYRDMLRDRIAADQFAGVGVGDDTAFTGALRKKAQERQAHRELTQDLTTMAGAAATAAKIEVGAGKSEAMSWERWRDEARKKPGYDPANEAEYLEHWNKTQGAIKEALAPFGPTLRDAWNALQGGDLNLAQFYGQLQPEEREPFLASLAVLARSMPEETQATFWSNLVKSRDRAGAGIISDILGGRMADVPLFTGRSDEQEDREAYERQSMGFEAGPTREEQRIAMRNFEADINRIRDATYDPVKVLNPDNTFLRVSEKAAYAAPQLIGFLAVAATPVIGTPATMMATESMLYRQMRDSALQAGATDEAASKFAYEAAPLVTLPYAALEKIGVNAALGKLPVFNRFLTATADRLSKGYLRFGARMTTTAAGETLIENTQDFLPSLTQEAAAALSQDVPGVVWKNGKDGFLDGYWEDTAVTFGVMLPLSIFAGMGGINRDARARAFQEASDTQLVALGYSPASISDMRAASAQGLFSMDAAIEKANASRNPMSAEAKVAVEQIKAEAEAASAAQEAADQSGVMPRFFRDENGWTVFDGETNLEVGKAQTAEDAMRLATAHSSAINSESADQTAFLFSALEAGDATVNAGTAFELAPGRKVTATQKAAESAQDEARILEQVAAKEALDGNGEFAGIVLGESVTTFKDKVRNTVNRINAGGTTLTVFHEESHGFFREALATGRLTKDETIAAIRSFDAVLGPKAEKFLPNGEITDTQLDEAVAEFMEAEILRTRKGGGIRKLPPGVITRNLTAAARLAPGAAKKFARFINTVREFWGATFRRAVSLGRAVREGKVKESDIDAFVSKLMGLDQQDAHNERAAKVAAEITGQPAASFSLGPAKMADVLGGAAVKKSMAPKAKAAIFQGIAARMAKLRELANRTGNAYNFDAFGKPYEGEARFSQEKKDTLNALAILDGILMAMPPDLRGRVGGFVQLAKLDTQEKRLDYLKRRLGTVERVVNDYLKREYKKALEQILEKAKPKREGGKKAKGKLGAAAHRFFEKVEAATNLSEEEVEAESAKINKKITDADPNDIELLGELAEDYQILNTFGTFSERSPGEMAAAVDLLNEVYDKNRNAWRTLEEARLAEVKALTEQAIKDLGSPKPGAVQRRKKQDNKIFEKIQGGKWAIKSFVEVLEGVFGKDSEITKRWAKAARDGFRARTSAIIKAQKRWKTAIEKATGKKGRAARRAVWEMATEFSIKATPTPIQIAKIKVPIDTFFDSDNRSKLGLTDIEVAQLTEQFEALPAESRKGLLTLERRTPKETELAEFTEAEAVYLTMMWSQEGYREAMRLHGLGDSFQAELESGLSDAAKGIRQHLANEYADNYEPLRKLFAGMFGVDLQRTENYTPGKFYSTGDDVAMDVTGSGFVDGGFKQGWLKDRKKHSAEARAENAFAVYFNHLNQTEHWKALAETSREIHGVLGKPEVKKALAAKDPRAAAALYDWLKAIDGNGFNNPKTSWLLDAITSSQAYLALAWKLSTIAKNAVGATLNAAYRMPTKDFLVGLSRVMAGKVEFKRVFDSEIIQNRLAGGFAPEVRSAISDAFGSEPTRRADFLLKGMEVIGTADAFGTAIGAAITYDYHYRNAVRAGMDAKQADRIGRDEAAETISRTAQPVEITDRSLMELRLSGIGKLAFVFASEARQKSALWLTAWGNALTGKPTAADVRVLLISHLVMAPIMQAISAAIRDARDHEDDEWFDDKYWNPKDFAKAAAAGPLSGLPLIRDVFDGYNGESGPLKRFFDMGKSGYDLLFEEPKGDEMDWYEQKVMKTLQGTTPSVAVSASIFDQIYDLLRNAID